MGNMVVMVESELLKNTLVCVCVCVCGREKYAVPSESKLLSGRM